MANRRRWIPFLFPLALGSIVLAFAAAYPAANVHGSAAIGPQAVEPVMHPYDGPSVSAGWGAGHRSILLRVRPRRSCPVELGAITSTAPARIEVTLRPDRDVRCHGAVVPQTFALPLPTVRVRGQAIKVLVDTKTIGVR